MSWTTVALAALVALVLVVGIMVWCVVSVARQYGSSIARRSVTLYERMYSLSSGDDVLWLAQMPTPVARAYAGVTAAVRKQADKEATVDGS